MEVITVFELNDGADDDSGAAIVNCNGSDPPSYLLDDFQNLWLNLSARMVNSSTWPLCLQGPF